MIEGFEVELPGDIVTRARVTGSTAFVQYRDRAIADLVFPEPRKLLREQDVHVEMMSLNAATFFGMR